MKLNIKLFLVEILFICATLNHTSAQEWLSWYNGPDNGWDIAYALAIDNTGNVYVTGESDGGGTGHDYATVKYDSSGVEQWVARYNGTGNSWDVARAIAIDNTGNIYITGGSYGSWSGPDYATVKYDSSGAKQWVAWYNGPGNWDDGASAIVLDNASNVYVTGVSAGIDSVLDYATVKYDSSGIQQWVVRYNGPDSWNDGASAITVDDVGNVYVTGWSRSTGVYYDYATVKYNSSGIEQWTARYNGPGNGWDIACAIAVDNAGNVYVTGESDGGDIGHDYATVKYDSSGGEQWVARYNGTGNSSDAARAIAIDNTGNIYVTGESWNFDTEDDYVTVKYDSSGVELWAVRYNGPSNSADRAHALVLDNMDNVYVTGQSWNAGTSDDYATVKYDSSGTELWVARYNGPSNNADHANAIVVDDAGYVYVTGESWNSGTAYDYATIKYSSTGISEDIVTGMRSRFPSATIFSGPLRLPKGRKCKVFDITGRVVAPDKLRPGIYFIQIDGKICEKVIKVK